MRSSEVKCIITGHPADIHHILTRKSHPEFIDKSWNQIPLSRNIHQLWHCLYTAEMAKRYWQIREWLESHNWEYHGDWKNGKWWPKNTELP